MKSPYRLTERELAVFQDPDFMPLKAKVWAKIEVLLSQLQEQLEEKIPEFSEQLPKEFIYSSGKLSRGENYKTYSYRVMDYPRVFQGDDIFTFRCVVLWGHPIGFHLILRGKYKEEFQDLLLGKLANQKREVWLSDQDDPWVWEQDLSRQILLQGEVSEPVRQKILAKTFFRVSYYLPSEEYFRIPEEGLGFWEEIFSIAPG
ncbi:MAG: hypothetical protein R3B93_27370 [Bacteroidia bacterium]